MEDKMSKIILIMIPIFFVSIGSTKSISHICKKTSNSLINIEKAITKIKLNTDQALKEYNSYFNRQIKVAKLYHYLDCRKQLGE